MSVEGASVVRYRVVVIRVLRKGCGESWGIEFELWLPTEPMESVPSLLQTTHTCTGVGQSRGGGGGWREGVHSGWEVCSRRLQRMVSCLEGERC